MGDVMRGRKEQHCACMAIVTVIWQETWTTGKVLLALLFS